MFVHFCIKEKMVKVYDFVFDFRYFATKEKKKVKMRWSWVFRKENKYFTHASRGIQMWHNDKSFHSIVSHSGKQMETLLARAAIFYCIVTHPKTIQDLDVFRVIYNSNTQKITWVMGGGLSVETKKKARLFGKSSVLIN